MSIYSKMYKNISAYYVSLQAQYSAKYIKEAMLGIALLVALGGGYWINRWYVHNREARAFEALAEIVNAYSQTQRLVMGLDSQKDQEKIKQSWHDTALLIDALSKEHASSYLAPCFLAYKSQIILEKDRNLVESIKVLDEALSGIGKNTEFGNIFYIKRIKMGFDMQDADEQKKSFEQLRQLAQDSTSFVQQEAQYTLGMYYIAQGQLALAQETFKELVNNSDAAALIQSPWVRLAQDKLGLSPQS